MKPKYIQKGFNSMLYLVIICWNVINLVWQQKYEFDVINIYQKIDAFWQVNFDFPSRRCRRSRRQKLTQNDFSVQKCIFHFTQLFPRIGSPDETTSHL